MGYVEPELYGSDESIIDHLLKGMGLTGGFEALKKTGTVFPSPEPLIQFPDLKFPTPSGMIEIASIQAEADGHPKLPQPIADPRPAANSLRLLSPAKPWLMNDTYANEARIAQEMGPASVALHPDDAAVRGIKDGDDVKVSNQTGLVALRAQISDEIRPGVALAHKGRWPKREKNESNLNFQNPGKKTDIGESSSVHGVEVMVTPVIGAY